MKMNQTNSNITKSEDIRVLEMLKAENGGFLSDESRLLEELRAENLLLTLQNENELLRKEVADLD